MSVPKYEKFSAIFLVAGLIFLLSAFLVLGLGPAAMIEKLNPRQGLPQTIPQDFKKTYATLEAYHQGLINGRDIYIKEACWHCHSQYVRPVSNESLRYGPVSQPGEYQNILNLPQLFGTRRVGPDLSRESGKRTNDWHFAHLYNPKWVEPRSIMPSFAWYFDTKTLKAGEKPSDTEVVTDGVVITPKQEAIDLVAYLQWLGEPYAEAQVRSQYGENAALLPPRQ